MAWHMKIKWSYRDRFILRIDLSPYNPLRQQWSIEALIRYGNNMFLFIKQDIEAWAWFYILQLFTSFRVYNYLKVFLSCINCASTEIHSFKMRKKCIVNRIQDLIKLSFSWKFFFHFWSKLQQFTKKSLNEPCCGYFI